MNLKEFELLFFDWHPPQLIFIVASNGCDSCYSDNRFQIPLKTFFLQPTLHCEVRFYLRKLKSVVACTVLSEMTILSNETMLM